MLASIQKIEDIRPIENADNIECARVLGWEVVVKKGEFKPGDLCIYVEIDTLIPRRDWSEFLFKGKEKEEGEEYYRLRTVKLRGQISQGLILPASQSILNPAGIIGIYTGMDVAEPLGIKHYEKPLPANYNPKSGMQPAGKFPSFLRKTDEVRIQSAPKLLEELKGKPYYITLKLDGTSATYYKYKGKFGVCSRNLELKNPYRSVGSWFDLMKDKIRLLFKIGQKKRSNPRTHSVDVYWQMAEKFRIADWLPDGFAIQGEIVGPSIQKNKMGLKETEFYIFNFFAIDLQAYADPMHIFQFIRTNKSENYPGIPCRFVPQMEAGKEFKYSLEELLLYADHIDYNNGTPAEGIVVRSLDQTISFKVVSNRFLLKYGE